MVQVWVQAVKEDMVWKFHDGTLFPIPDYCPIVESNEVTEIHFRYKNDDNIYQDAPPSNMFHYMCELLQEKYS